MPLDSSFRREFEKLPPRNADMFSGAGRAAGIPHGQRGPVSISPAPGQVAGGLAIKEDPDSCAPTPGATQH